MVEFNVYTREQLPVITTNLFGDTVQQIELWCQFCYNHNKGVCAKCTCSYSDLDAVPTKFKDK